MPKRNHLNAITRGLLAALCLGTFSIPASAADQPNTRLAKSQQAARYLPGEIIVKLRESRDAGIMAESVEYQQERARQAIGQALGDLDAVVPMDELSVETSRAEQRLHRVEVPAQVPLAALVKRLQQSGEVEYAEPNFLYQTQVTSNDEYFGQMWNLHNTQDTDIDAPEAWDLHTGSKQTVVMVIDTGAEITHPDLAANIWTNPWEIAGNGLDDDNNGYVDDIHGIGPHKDDKSDPGEVGTSNHGTHVAGTIGATGNNGIGVSGVAWNTTILPCSTAVSASGLNGWAIVQCMDYAVELKKKGVNIVATNNSYGSGGRSQSYYDAISRLREVGILAVCAAGNSGRDADVSPMWPAAFSTELDNVISVGNMDANGNRSGSSNWGAQSVNLFAPGSGIWSTIPGGRYQTKSGTSMASPHVAGAAALVAAMKPDYNYLQIKAALYDAVKRTPTLQPLSTTGGMLKLPRLGDDTTPPPGGDNGVAYRYYEGSWTTLPDFASLPPKASGKVANFVIGERQRDDQFGFRFEAELQIDSPGTYTFYTRSDDGSRLLIDGRPVVNNDGVHPAVEQFGQVSLDAGRHPIVVEYFEYYGGETLEVSYEGPGVAKSRIPEAKLFSASAAPIEGTYGLVSVASERCLDVSGGSTRDGGVLIQWDCHGRDNQRWTLEPKGDGFYSLQAVHSGKVMDVRGASTAANALMIQWPATGADNQLFKLEAQPGGSYRLRAKHSDLCVAMASTANGESARQQACDAGSGQQWKLVR